MLRPLYTVGELGFSGRWLYRRRLFSVSAPGVVARAAWTARCRRWDWIAYRFGGLTFGLDGRNYYFSLPDGIYRWLHRNLCLEA